MRLVEQPVVGFDNGITLTFKVPISAREELKTVFDTIEKFNAENEYVLTFERRKRTRTLDANSYMWVLCDKIAKVVKTTKEEVYRRAIREAGVFSDVAVQDGEPCAELISSWGSNGIGYFAELFDTPLLDKDGGKMKRVRLYKGSHTYSSIELSSVIDYLIDDAKALGIQTMTDREIKELYSWQNHQ